MTTSPTEPAKPSPGQSLDLIIGEAYSILEKKRDLEVLRQWGLQNAQQRKNK
jgi:hypothetical protein